MLRSCAVAPRGRHGDQHSPPRGIAPMMGPASWLPDVRKRASPILFGWLPVSPYHSVSATC